MHGIEVGMREISMGMRGIEMGIVYFQKIFQSSYFHYTTKLHLLTSQSDSW